MTKKIPRCKDPRFHRKLYDLLIVKKFTRAQAYAALNVGPGGVQDALAVMKETIPGFTFMLESVVKERRAKPTIGNKRVIKDFVGDAKKLISDDPLYQRWWDVKRDGFFIKMRSEHG